jgi:hypothetical protein
LPGLNEYRSKSLAGRFAPAINHQNPFNLSALTWPEPIARPWTVAALLLPFSNASAARYRQPCQQGERMAGPDRRSDQAAAYRAWYKTSRWRSIRSNQLAAKPLCEWCASSGRTALATVCDHAKPHRGDPALFHQGPFLSLCKPCHDGAAQRRDRLGYSGAVDVSGWPIDSNHPANRRPTGAPQS